MVPFLLFRLTNPDVVVSTVLREESSMPVPPNFLYFEICLECFMGYEVEDVFGPGRKDPSLPKAAIMGGAVLAALSSWRDEYIVSLFDEIRLEDYLVRDLPVLSDNYPSRNKRIKTMFHEEYFARKRKLKKMLHEYFLSTGDEDGQSSIFHAGDVDVFLQAPSLPRLLYAKLLEKCGGKADIVGAIQSWMGGIGWAHEDLRNFAYELLGPLSAKYEEEGEFVHALARNGLSFMYGTIEPAFNSLEWPRNTQLIMLDPRADLLGAILDFDISTVACAFDGVTVRATPRAVLSLVRKVAAVTPFCFEEKRNRRRIMKYCRRGFFPIIIDPNCLHDRPCHNLITTRIGAQPPAQAQEPASVETNPQAEVTRRCWQWNAPSKEAIDDVNRTITRIGRGYDPQNPTPLLCCCTRHGVQYEEGRMYFISQFEEREGDAMDFFADLNNWDDAMRTKANKAPKHLKLACHRCRFQYAAYHFLKDNKSVINSSDNGNEDPLRREMTLKIQRSSPSNYRDYFKPSFYSGPAFDSTKVRERARHPDKARSLLQGQSHAERLQYMVQHGTVQGYQQRFTYPSFECGYYDVRRSLREVFDEAAKVTLARPARPPIGLNPERFIANCQGCGEWLHGNEYGTAHCSKCQDSKPPAV